MDKMLSISMGSAVYGIRCELALEEVEISQPHNRRNSVGRERDAVFVTKPQFISSPHRLQEK